MAKRLAIVGAGPKAAAIVARAAVLRRTLGDRVPTLIVLEEHGVAAAWGGHGNYSNGFVTLCTPGERDVGFPYVDAAGWGPTGSIASELYADFSWGAYLVATGRFADWVDRERDHPSHARFADYLRWVFERAGIEPFVSTVKRVRPHDDKWCVHYVREGKARELVVDAVVLTGNGDPRAVEAAGVPANRVFDAATFWPARDLFMGEDALEVVVAGDGGSAGTIVAWLADRFRETKSRIWSVSPMGTLFPRGDGHAERRWFSDPSEWRGLSVTHRRKLIDRTEAGVVSLRNKSTIDRSSRVEYEAGHLRSIAWDADEGRLALSVAYDGGAARPLGADLVVNAIGFDQWSRLALVDLPGARSLVGPAAKGHEKAFQDAREAVELDIQPDLSMSAASGFPPGLHVPALAGLAHGPGMGNLGCLGLMAAKVLDGHLS